MKPFRLNRRTMLRGAGAALALPALEAMMDSRGRIIKGAHAAGGKPPVRFMGFLMQNGCPKQWYSPIPVGAPADAARGAANVLTDYGGNVRYYDPAKVGEQYELNIANKPLQPFKGDINQITGLHQRSLRSVFEHSDGAVACFIGYPMHSKPRDGKPERGSAPSLDWLLGKSVGKDLPHQALYLSLRRDQPRMTNRDYRVSWIADEQAATPIDNPAALAAKLIPPMRGTTMVDPAVAAEGRRTRTILDFVRADATDLQAKLGAADRARLDQHLTSVQELVRQIERSATAGQGCTGKAPDAPAGQLPDEMAMPLMAKLIAFGYACDLFRYGIFHVQMAWALPNTENGHDHSASHTVMDRNNIYYWDKKMQFLAMILDALKKTPEGDKDLLYNSFVCTGVDVAVGAKHNFDDLPIILAGNGGGAVKTGRHLNYKEVTYNNLYCSILNHCGLPMAKYGADGTGPLPGLVG